MDGLQDSKCQASDEDEIGSQQRDEVMGMAGCGEIQAFPAHPPLHACCFLNCNNGSFLHRADTYRMAARAGGLAELRAAETEAANIVAKAREGASRQASLQ